jgi:predicted nucleic acid-binding protein
VLLVDTNVLVDVVEDDPQWVEWSLGQLRIQSQVHELAINPVIYSELSLAFDDLEELDGAIHGMDLVFREMPRPALFLAGRAYLAYRRTGGSKRNVLADFFIGAHAAVVGCGILTRDIRRYRNYFPSVPLIAPNGAATARSRNA